MKIFKCVESGGKSINVHIETCGYDAFLWVMLLSGYKKLCKFISLWLKEFQMLVRKHF
jgi:hypothetical protein